MSKREELAPYNNERLYVEGVLIDITKPNKKNHHKAGLVFGSVYLPNEDIELDHIVIAVPETFTRNKEIELFNKYGFTAEVGSYYKKKNILGTLASVKAYHLQDINSRRFETIEPVVKSDLSRYLKNRLSSLHRRGVPVDMTELNYALREKKEGERELYLKKIMMTLNKKDVTHADIMNAIY